MAGPSTSEPAGPSIRAQAKKGKQQQQPQGQGGSAVDRSSANKTVVKAVLANPLTVPWPNIPRHLQTTVLANLPAFVPAEIAEYHTARARCQTKEKRSRRTEKRAAAIKEAYATAGQLSDAEAESEAPGNEPGASRQAASALSRVPPAESGSVPNDAMDQEDSAEQAGLTGAQSAPRRPHPPNTQIPRPRPAVPAILDHLVLGINEVIKALERQTDELRLRVMMIGDALSEQQQGGKKRKRTAMDDISLRSVKKGGRELLPTAPPRDDEDDEAEAGSHMEAEEEAIAGGGQVDLPMTGTKPASPLQPVEIPITARHLESSDKAPLPKPLHAPVEWIVLPLASISPQALVSPIPAYCATYNTLVYQHTHISKIARTRLPASRAELVVGAQVEEVRVVPLGKVEEEMAAMVGLRRLACMGIRASHPHINILRNLLPKSILHPPRHSLTLPFPTSALTVHAGSAPTSTVQTSKQDHSASHPSNTAATKHEQPATKRAKADALLPHIHYAPLHVKGITTTIPADGNARKQKRMEEVRAMRRLAKERKKLERRKG